MSGPIRLVPLIISLAALATVGPAVLAQGLRPGTIAPEWSVSEWIGQDPGSLAEQRGKVVLIDFFQLWCPGCKEFSIPLFERWNERYGSRDDVLVVSIHTVFEGHGYQNPRRLRRFIAERDIAHSVGVDAYADRADDTPITMRRYRTGGTPHVVVIDVNGVVRSHFGGFDPASVEALIERLLGETENEDQVVGETVAGAPW